MQSSFYTFVFLVQNHVRIESFTYKSLPVIFTTAQKRKLQTYSVASGNLLLFAYMLGYSYPNALGWIAAREKISLVVQNDFTEPKTC